MLHPPWTLAPGTWHLAGHPRRWITLRTGYSTPVKGLHCLHEARPPSVHFASFDRHSDGNSDKMQATVSGAGMKLVHGAA